MLKKLVQQNLPLFSIVLFLIAYMYIVIVKPPYIYNLDGSLKEFGVGYSKKTIIPLWLVAIFIGVLSYFFVLYYSIENPYNVYL